VDLRAQVLVLDIAVFFTACFALADILEGGDAEACAGPRGEAKKESRTSTDHERAVSRRALARVALALAAPAPVLIDHGHFQYNSVALGLALHAVVAIARGRELVGAAFFCAALNFKQMALYYAPGIFFHLLARCVRRRYSGAGGARARSWRAPLAHVVQLGAVVVVSFALLWVPFCVRAAPDVGCAASLLQVLKRQFPFSRGIFEDKVANAWRGGRAAPSTPVGKARHCGQGRPPPPAEPPCAPSLCRLRPLPDAADHSQRTIPAVVARAACACGSAGAGLARRGRAARGRGHGGWGCARTTARRRAPRDGALRATARSTRRRVPRDGARPPGTRSRSSHACASASRPRS